METAIHIDRSRIEYHVGVFVASAGQSHPLIEGLRKRGYPVHELVDDGNSLRSVAARVISLIDMLGIEIVHASEFRSNMIALLCRRRRRIRLVSTAHGWIANDLRGQVKTLFDRILLRRFDRVILVSEAMRKRLPVWWGPDKRVRILRNALVFERFCTDSRRVLRQVLNAERNITLLNVGRLSPEKGQTLLLKAVAALAAYYPTLQLVIAGTGPLEAELRQLSAKLNIANRVKFIGYVPDIESVYGSSDLVVQSSYTEGLPNVVLEAAYLGVPIVATDVGGTAEVIEHGVSGWLVQPRSVQELIAGIRHFLEHPAHFAVMTRAARARIEKEFLFKARTEAQMRIYQELGGTSS